MKSPELLDSPSEETLRPKRNEYVPDFAKDAELVIATFNKTRPRISERSFVGGLYTAEQVERDLEFTNRQRTKFAKQNQQEEAEGFLHEKEVHQLATAMEVIVTQPLAWWGKGKITRTSEYDDFKGIDAVLEIPGAQHMGFAFDFSTSNSFQIIKEKIDKATQHITTPEKPAKVKYYISPITKKQESITVIPVVIGLDSADSQKLVGLMSNIIRLKERATENPALRKKLEEELAKLQKHPAQMVFILEINNQLDRYQKLLEDATDPRLIAMRARIDGMTTFIRELGLSRAKEGISTEQLEDDQVFRTIRAITNTKKTPENRKP